MAHSNQARKRARQNEKLRIRNKSVRNEIKSLTKTLFARVGAKDVAGAEALLKQVTSKLDKAAKDHVYHRNAVARQKSRICSMVHALSSQVGAGTPGTPAAPAPQG